MGEFNVDEFNARNLRPVTLVLAAVRWRTGRHNNRTLYAMVGDEPTREDVMIGTMDPGLGQHVVDVHNASLDSEGT